MSDDKPETLPLARPHCDYLDSILGQQFDVLNDGFIRVVDYLGNDKSVVQAARTSYGSGTTKVLADRNLLRLLMRQGHTSPFEMAEIKLHVRVPMDCWRQWIRHRTANVNEYSTRYSEAIDSMQTTAPDQWRLQAEDNKQGSAGLLDAAEGLVFTKREKGLHDHATTMYKMRLERGIAREQARKDLPLSTYTTAYWKIDLHNLLHFLKLRMSSHAQQEIREYANIIGRQIVAGWLPTVWKAFEDYTLDAIRFSVPEQEILIQLLRHNVAMATLTMDRVFKESKREKREFMDKITKLGFTFNRAPKATEPEMPAVGA